MGMQRGVRRVRGVMLALVVSMCALSVPRAHAQRLGPEPKKKRSAFVTDTNNANALYESGLRAIGRDPSAAADAFYWAARINPAYAEPLYGRRAAILLRDASAIRELTTLGKRKPSKELQRLDSLQLRAFSLNPFLFRRFDRLLLVESIRQSVTRSAGGEKIDGAELNYVIEQYLGNVGNAEIAAWMAYADGDQATALGLYATAIKRSKNTAGLRVERGRIFAMRGQSDSAIAEFRKALEEMSARENKDLILVYNSKAMIEHSIATLLEGADDVAGAREAYGRALQEDLAFYPAHVRLGLLLMSHGDTTAALSELETATQVAGDEPWVRYSYGYALLSAGEGDAAFEQLNNAIELEPLYARPYATIAELWVARGDAARAIAAYEGFLTRAPANDPQRASATKALEELRKSAKPGA